ncbi:MAG: hypothetical protein H7Z10_10880, partial [Gemmatimonadaceae bacterium]|nr:hypothetical protein [Acetobacteraceae bacterium]
VRQAVLQVDAAQRRIVVGPRSAGSDRVRLREVNWLLDPPIGPLRCTVKLRAREAAHGATVSGAEHGAAVVTLDTPALAAAGQACVLYAGDRVLGGGFIDGRPIVEHTALPAGDVAQR